MKLTEDTGRNHLLLLGDSGTGKTGSLVSLVAAGYKLYILDLENGTKILRNMIMQQCPDKIENVEVEKIATKYTIESTGAKAERAPRGLARVGKTIDQWQSIVSPDDIIVIDSLTALGRLCLVWSKAQNPGLKDNRQHYFNAQEVIEPIVAVVTHEDFPCHTITITHIDYREVAKDTTKGYASAVGRALGDKIPTHYNEVFKYATIGVGRAAKRVISSVSDGITDVKNTAPNRVKAQYGIDTGLAEIFAHLQGEDYKPI